MVTENYPQLRATEGFQNLQAQLEGTENRISVERNNFNAAVQEYNTALGRFPTNMLNKMFGFQPRPFFTAQAGSETAPSVNFPSFAAAVPAPRHRAAPRARCRRTEFRLAVRQRPRLRQQRQSPRPRSKRRRSDLRLQGSARLLSA